MKWGKANKVQQYDYINIWRYRNHRSFLRTWNDSYHSLLKGAFSFLFRMPPALGFDLDIKCLNFYHVMKKEFLTMFLCHNKCIIFFIQSIIECKVLTMPSLFSHFNHVVACIKPTHAQNTSDLRSFLSLCPCSSQQPGTLCCSSTVSHALTDSKQFSPSSLHNHHK